MIDNIPLIIFAGGKSSRMGQDKALLPFGGYPSLAEFQYHKFAPYFKHIYLSSKTDKFDFDCNIIRDTQHTSSPLVAILSVFETLAVDEIFVLSVDAPFVDITVIEKVLKKREEAVDIVVAQSPSGIQPLCGSYKRTMLALASSQVAEENHKLRDLLALAQTKQVMFKEDLPFANLNKPQEYQEALNRFYPQE